MTRTLAPTRVGPSWRRYAAADVAARHAAVLGDAGDTEGRWVTLEDLLADDAAVLRAAHAALVDRGSAPQAAAKHLLGWIGGLLARTVGWTWVTADAGVLVDDGVRWRLLPGGWPDRADVTGCAVLVAPGHPWATGDESGEESGVRTVHGPDRRPEAVVAALATTLSPLVEAAGRLAKVGRTALWSEIADALGDAASGEADTAAYAADELDRLLGAVGTPWRVRPRLWCASGATGPRAVCHRGGCCLAYLATPPATPTEIPAETAELDPTPAALPDVTPEERARAAFSMRFPTVAGERAYCANCRFRGPDDVETRTVFWCDRLDAERSRARRAEALAAALEAAPSAARICRPD